MSILDDSETGYISEIYSQDSKIFRGAIDSLINEKIIYGKFLIGVQIKKDFQETLQKLV